MTKVLHRIGWIGLTLVGAFMVFAVVSDLTADHRTGLPTDHAGTFTFTFGRHDSAILGRSLIADVAVPVFLLLCVPAVFGVFSGAADGLDAASPIVSSTA